MTRRRRDTAPDDRSVVRRSTPLALLVLGIASEDPKDTDHAISELAKQRDSSVALLASLQKRLDELTAELGRRDVEVARLRSCLAATDKDFEETCASRLKFYTELQESRARLSLLEPIYAAAKEWRETMTEPQSPDGDWKLDAGSATSHLEAAVDAALAAEKERADEIKSDVDWKVGAVADVLCLVTFMVPVRVLRMDRAERVQAVIVRTKGGIEIQAGQMVRLPCIETWAADSTSSTKHTVTLDVPARNIAGIQAVTEAPSK